MSFLISTFLSRLDFRKWRKVFYPRSCFAFPKKAQDSKRNKQEEDKEDIVEPKRRRHNTSQQPEIDEADDSDKPNAKPVDKISSSMSKDFAAWCGLTPTPHRKAIPFDAWLTLQSNSIPINQLRSVAKAKNVGIKSKNKDEILTAVALSYFST
jgi:hypothetical protein